jgi:predicted Rossmann fold nucleotide-binding protein DprA/Smf involved in DNA uptake
MARDRIMSGLSRAVIVIKAGEKCGSLVVSG